MTAELQKKCKGLIEEYFALDEEEGGSRKGELRNQIFTLMYPFLCRWVAAAIGRKGQYRPKMELTSLCWDAFLYGLTNYNNTDVPLPFHFNKSCGYFVALFLNEDRKIKRKTVNIEDLDCPEHDVCLPPHDVKVISSYEFLSTFREYLNDSYKMVFDDALMNRDSNTPHRTKDGPHLPFYRYNEAKKVFRVMINFFMLGV
jgi:hypothetical protein